uniref:Uncharacterized protein n=1 Tax=Strigamia maritima TaxID=126957 RepID=T1JPG9_STRMM
MACRNENVQLIVSSPIGDICIVSCTSGLHSVSRMNANFAPQENIPVVIKSGLSHEELWPPVADAVKWLRIYFHRPKEIENAIRPALCATLIA